MANTKTWPDPDSQINQQGRKDVMGVYMIDPVTQKATVPGTVSNQRVNAQSGDFVAGSIVDLLTLLTLAGTAGDANTVNSLMGRLTKIRDLLNATLTVQGTITEANSAAIKSDLDTLITNTADLLADGDNLATIAANTTGIATAANQTSGNTNTASIAANTANNTNIGASGDAAVVGDNAGSLSAKLRGLTKILNDIWDSTNHLFHTNIKQWNGAAPSVTNPVITEDQIRQWIANGQGYSATTGKLTAVAANQAFSLFNPGATTLKNVLVYSLKVAYTQANTQHDLRLATTDPAFASSATISNNKPGGAATAGVTATYAITTQTAAGTAYDGPLSGTNASQEVFTNGNVLLLPTGASNGLALYLGNTAAGSFAVTVKWIEY